MTVQLVAVLANGAGSVAAITLWFACGQRPWALYWLGMAWSVVFWLLVGFHIAELSRAARH